MSGKRLQLKRGTTAQTSIFTGLNGEVTVDTTKKTLVVHDGSMIGGTVLAKASDVELKVDKIAGKGLSTEDYTSIEKTKLAGISASANNYTHPSSHDSSMITETTTKRFVSDAEKTAWNEKIDSEDYASSTVGGTVKVRYVTETQSLYIRTDGTDA